MKKPLKYLFCLSALAVLSSFVFYPGDTKEDSKDLKIVYNVLLDKTCSTYEIFTMNLDGSNKKNVSNWKGADWAYATHDDKIYFVSDRDSTSRLWFLYEMDVNGNNIRRISEMQLQDSYVSVNSTGKEIIVCPYIKDKKWFFVLDIKTGKTIDTITIPLLNIAHACYLPGDKQFLFVGQKEKRMPEELFVINIDGSGLRQITHYPENDTTAKWYETHTGNPVWNKQQKIISYFSKQNGNHSIHTVELDGTGAKKITDDKFNEGWHSWSPDGKLIVYDGSDLEDKNFDIYIMNSDGTNTKRLTTDSITEQAPLFIRSKK